MKTLIALIGLCLAFATLPETHAQGRIMPVVTKLTSSTTIGGNVILEDTVNQVSRSFPKSRIYTSTSRFSSGVAGIHDISSGKTIWQGAVSGVRITGTSPALSDSLKILYIRQHLTNTN